MQKKLADRWLRLKNVGEGGHLGVSVACRILPRKSLGTCESSLKFLFSFEKYILQNDLTSASLISETFTQDILKQTYNVGSQNIFNSDLRKISR